MKIKVLYEDSNILVIDKPSGIAVHGDGRSKKKTITDWVLKNYPKMERVGEPMHIINMHQVKSLKVHKVKNKKEYQSSSPNLITILRPGIVHRLDRDTSGVLLLAKNQKTYEFLKDQFKNRKIKKTYNAIVSGWVKDDRGIINKTIGRSPKDFRRYLSGRGARGEMREAITRYKVIKRIKIKIFSSKFTYLEIYPKTGRTHQIRVHMKFLNHPIACDSLYNPRGICPSKIKRLALHASSIEFKDLKDKVVKVQSPLPKEFLI